MGKKVKTKGAFKPRNHRELRAVAKYLCESGPASARQILAEARLNNGGRIDRSAASLSNGLRAHRSFKSSKIEGDRQGAVEWRVVNDEIFEENPLIKRVIE